MANLNVGDKAPDFKLKDKEGKVHSLKDFKGKTLILYFYPKDDTPGCTLEACNLRDDYKRLKRKGIVVLGVSPDSERSHRKFSEKYKLPFTLLSDPEKKAAESYGVWGKKRFMGREYMGILRTTFIIEKGKIKHIIDKVEVKNHADQILNTLKK